MSDTALRPSPADPFQHVEDEYFRLKGQLSAGRLTQAQFEAALKELMVQDATGRWWMIGAESARWYVHDGQNWVEARPPAAITSPPQPPAVISDDSALFNRNTGAGGSVGPTPVPTAAKRSRRLLWIVLLLVFFFLCLPLLCVSSGALGSVSQGWQQGLEESVSLWDLGQPSGVTIKEALLTTTLPVSPDYPPAAATVFPAAGEDIYLALITEPVRSAAEVRATWYSGDARIGEGVVRPNRDDRMLVFSLPPPGDSWTPGDYRVEISVGDQVVKTVPFQVQ